MSPSDPRNSLSVCLQTPQGAVKSVWWAMTATALNFKYPSETALGIAQRSAHIVGDNVEFSMLHPQKTFASSSVSMAAPTGKFE